jgi:hypothetical protein
MLGSGRYHVTQGAAIGLAISWVALLILSGVMLYQVRLLGNEQHERTHADDVTTCAFRTAIEASLALVHAAPQYEAQFRRILESLPPVTCPPP